MIPCAVGTHLICWSSTEYSAMSQRMSWPTTTLLLSTHKEEIAGTMDLIGICSLNCNDHGTLQLKKTLNSFLVCRCRDYIRIIRPIFGVLEFCGNTFSRPSYVHLSDPAFTVVFRTSEVSKGGKGFQMYVTCFRTAENNEKGICNRNAS